MSVSQQSYMPAVPDFLSKDEIALLKRTLLAKFAEDEQESFIRQCQRTKLDPFTKQIYATRRYQKQKDADGNTRKVPTLVPVTSIQGLAAVAERTQNYDGCEIFWSGKDGEWKSEWLNGENPEAAKCIVYHKRHSHPEVGIARWGSYVGTQWNQERKVWEITEFWDKMGDYMLAKCAKAQALRGAFPDQLSDIYIGAELHGNITEAETETETIPADEQKIIDNRKREAEIQASGQFQVVEQRVPERQPTPEEMTEPALERDKIPPPPVVPPPRAPEPELSSPMTEIAQAPPPPPWTDHVIQSITHVKFKGRKIGEFGPGELAVIEQQWLPAIRAEWENATDAQRADAEAFERAIAYHKMEKPTF